MTVTATRTDLAAWDRLIGDAVRDPDPTLSNLKVTRTHYLLSLALRDVVGAGAGANFHTWAVWGSRKAGVTIRQEGLDRALREVTILALCAGLLTGFLLGLALSPWLPGWVAPALSAVGAAAGAWTGRRWLAYGRPPAARGALGRGARGGREDLGEDGAPRPRPVAGQRGLRRGAGVGAGRRGSGGGALPETATVDIRKASRGGGVYIDVLQNARGHHAVPPYVLRAVPGATVSTPLRWAELSTSLDPGRFTLKTVPARIARQKADPAAPLVSGK
jgi:hypothetical protein